MDILRALDETGAIDQISRRYGISQEEIRSVVRESMPEIQEAIRENTSTPQGYANFLGAIKDHENDDLTGMIKDVGTVDKEDGDKIMTHIFGQRKDNINDQVSRKSNSSPINTKMIMALLLPMILSMLGKSARNNQVYEEDRRVEDKRNDGGILEDIFGGQRTSAPTRRNSPISDIGEAGTGRRYEQDTRYREPNGYQVERERQERGGGLMDIVGEILTGQGSSKSSGGLGSILGDLLRK